MYTILEAAQLAGTTHATVRKWLTGYSVPGHAMAPVFDKNREGQRGEPILVSFLELVEIVVVAGFRHGSSSAHSISLERLRRAHEYAKREFALPYPFASLPLREAGGHVLHAFDVETPGGPRLALDLGGQWELPGMVRTELERLDFDKNQAVVDPYPVRWFPKGRDVQIVVDPHLAAGRPTIFGRGITVDTIRRRWLHGEPILSIANDYELEPEIVEKALQYAA